MVGWLDGWMVGWLVCWWVGGLLRWLTRPWLGNYDLLLVSSELAKEFFEDYGNQFGFQTACVFGCPEMQLPPLFLDEASGLMSSVRYAGPVGVSCGGVHGVGAVEAAGGACAPPVPLTTEVAADDMKLKAGAALREVKESPVVDDGMFKSFYEKLRSVWGGKASGNFNLLGISNDDTAAGLKGGRNAGHADHAAAFKTVLANFSRPVSVPRRQSSGRRMRVPVEVLRIAANPAR